jgi:mannose-6-phosphate isomerase class I
MAVLEGKEAPRLLKDVLGAEIPYLFKVLSVDLALSVQAHPNKVSELVPRQTKGTQCRILCAATDLVDFAAESCRDPA